MTVVYLAIWLVGTICRFICCLSSEVIAKITEVHAEPRMLLFLLLLVVVVVVLCPKIYLPPLPGAFVRETVSRGRTLLVFLTGLANFC